MRRSTDGLLEDLLRQKKAIEPRLPVYGRLLGTIVELYGTLHQPLSLAWRSRLFNAYYDRPLLILAALRADALRTGPQHPLWSAIAVDRPQADAVSRSAVAGALKSENVRVWKDLRTRFVQTNETLRSLVWLWPLRLSGHRGEIVLVDLGASAGLNLMADRLDCPWYLPSGETLVAPQRVDTELRLGLDVRPLEVSRGEDALWLQACIWPGETSRIERLAQALAAFRRAEGPDRPVLEAVGARDWAERLGGLRAEYPSSVIFAYQSMVRDYMSEVDRRVWAEGSRRWLTSQPSGKALLAQLEMVNPYAGLECSVDVQVAIDGSAERMELARTGFHPGEVRPNPGSVQRFQSLFAAG